MDKETEEKNKHIWRDILTLAMQFSGVHGSIRDARLRLFSGSAAGLTHEDQVDAVYLSDLLFQIERDGWIA